jgi:hypothetical protein
VLTRGRVRDFILKIENTFKQLGETREARVRLAKWYFVKEVFVRQCILSFVFLRLMLFFILNARFESLAQQSLECCVEEIVQRCSELNEGSEIYAIRLLLTLNTSEHLRQFRMRPVGEWDEAEIGLSVKV